MFSFTFLFLFFLIIICHCLIFVVDGVVEDIIILGLRERVFN